MRFCCVNTAGRIKVLLGVRTLEDPRHIVLDGDGSPNFATARGGGFDAACAKLLWSLVDLYPCLSYLYFQCLSTCE